MLRYLCEIRLFMAGCKFTVTVVAVTVHDVVRGTDAVMR